MFVKRVVEFEAIMTNKELCELLKKYAESTRIDKEVVFKKLKEKEPQIQSTKTYGAVKYGSAHR